MGDAASAREVWYVLHGYAQLADDFLQSCAALASPDRLLVAPEGLSRFYGKAFAQAPGASWMTRIDREAEIRDYVEYLDTLHETLALDVPVTVLGYSQGGATASRWAGLGRVRPQRLVCWAGEVAHDLPDPARSLAGVDLTFVFGTRDRIVSPDRKQALVDRLDAAGLAYRMLSFDGGHRMDDDTLRKL